MSHLLADEKVLELVGLVDGGDHASGVADEEDDHDGNSHLNLLFSC